MVNKSPKQIAMEWMEAYNGHNPEIAASLYDENAINFQCPWNKSVSGREAIRNTYMNVFKAFPDIHLKVENIVIQVPLVVVEWRFSGTMKGEFSGQAPSSNSFSMQGCEIFQISNGKILIQRGYWDKATMFSQLKISGVV